MQNTFYPHHILRLIKNILNLLLFVCMNVCICIYEYSVWRYMKGKPAFLEESYSLPIELLGTKIMSSARAINALNIWTISLVSFMYFTLQLKSFMVYHVCHIIFPTLICIRITWGAFENNITGSLPTFSTWLSLGDQTRCILTIVWWSNDSWGWTGTPVSTATKWQCSLPFLPQMNLSGSSRWEASSQG